ncbi:MAG: hypothetical protein K1X77_02675 [Bacteroidia bacterium]|nr:hypothetical protein [Bacteroidia bacterium]
MRIAVVGLPFFAQRLVSDLCRDVNGFTFRAYDTYYSKSDKVKFALHLPFTDLVLSFNGVSDYSGSMELAMKMRKKICFQWQGTDVMLASERHHNGTLNRKYIDYGTHIAVAPWLSEELKQINIHAPTLDFKWIDPIDNLPPISELSAYTYLAEGRENFYGLQEVLQLATRHHEIVFKIVGSKGHGIHCPKNVQFLGWLNAVQMKDLRIHSPVYLRLTEHDGFSNAVLEAQSVGNEVIWTYPGLHCHHVSKESVFEVFTQVLESLKARSLSRNNESMNYIRTHHSRTKIINDLIIQIQEAIG